MPDGKLTIVGGGWSFTAPGVRSAIALYIQVPWDRANMRHGLRMELVDADGDPVMAGPDDAQVPVVIDDLPLEVGRPVGIKPGTPLDAAHAIDFPSGFPVEPGKRYEWRLSIDGESEDDWRLPFSVPGQQPGLMAA